MIKGGARGRGFLRGFTGFLSTGLAPVCLRLRSTNRCMASLNYPRDKPGGFSTPQKGGRGFLTGFTGFSATGLAPVCLRLRSTNRCMANLNYPRDKPGGFSTLQKDPEGSPYPKLGDEGISWGIKNPIREIREIRSCFSGFVLPIRCAWGLSFGTCRGISVGMQLARHSDEAEMFRFRRGAPALNMTGVCVMCAQCPAGAPTGGGSAAKFTAYQLFSLFFLFS
jgi:hypothetical protein